LKVTLIGVLVVAFLTLNSGSAIAQRADCPKEDAPRPMMPAGPPPKYVPEVDFRASPDEPRRTTRFPPPGPPKYGLLDAEEGHLAGMLSPLKYGSAKEPSADTLRQLVPVVATQLASWKLLGYERPHFRVHQVGLFTKDGSTLRFEQYRQFPDQGVAYRPSQANATIGSIPAWEGGIRSPSGCVKSTLNWTVDDLNFSLMIVGPLTWESQKALLMQIAASVEAARQRKQK